MYFDFVVSSVFEFAISEPPRKKTLAFFLSAIAKALNTRFGIEISNCKGAPKTFEYK